MLRIASWAEGQGPSVPLGLEPRGRSLAAPGRPGAWGGSVPGDLRVAHLGPKACPSHGCSQRRFQKQARAFAPLSQGDSGKAAWNRDGHPRRVSADSP